MSVARRFEDFQDQTNDPVAAAILVLADVLDNRMVTGDEIGHQICMGIRHGLFGNDSNEYTDIRHGISAEITSVRE